MFPDLEEDAARMAARHVKRAALDAALASQRTATQVAGQPASLPKRLRMDGVDVVELFVSGPGERRASHPLNPLEPKALQLFVSCPGECGAAQPPPPVLCLGPSCLMCGVSMAHTLTIEGLAIIPTRTLGACHVMGCL